MDRDRLVSYLGGCDDRNAEEHADNFFDKAPMGIDDGVVRPRIANSNDGLCKVVESINAARSTSLRVVLLDVFHAWHLGAHVTFALCCVEGVLASV